jgi:formylglycine-generating enzyme required for sulfatase activity
MAEHPVVEVSWYGAVAYCNWRSQQEGYQQLYDPCDPNWPCDFSKHGYRLATEAEWEYAARGGCHDPYYQYPWCDNSIDCSKANFDDGYYCNPLGLTAWPYTSPVGYYSQNNYGLYDMAGNVWEWCNDWYDSDYYTWCKDTCGEPCPNPTGPDSDTERVVRGGAWNNTATRSQTGKRHNNPPSLRDYDHGFRIVLDLE